MKGNGPEGVDNALQTCDQLLRLAGDQNNAIFSQDIDTVLELTIQREELISSLNLENTDFEFDGARQPNDPAMGKRLKLMEKLRDLIVIDEDNRQAMQTLLEDMKAQLGAMSRGRSALATYAYLKPQPQPIYVDKQR